MVERDAGRTRKTPNKYRLLLYCIMEEPALPYNGRAGIEWRTRLRSQFISYFNNTIFFSALKLSEIIR